MWLVSGAQESMKVTFLRSEVLELEESAVLVWPHAAKPKSWQGRPRGQRLGYKAFLHNDGSLIRCLSIVLWDCFERKSAENDMEGLDFRSTSAPDIPYESSGKPVCHTLVKLFHYRDRVGDLMRSRFVQSVLAAGSCL